MSSQETIDAIVLADKLRQDAEDAAANCHPHGTPDWPRLATDIEEDLELARRQRPAAANASVVEAGNVASQGALRDGYRVEKQPTGSWSLGNASSVGSWTSWTLGAQLETTRDANEIGSSNFHPEKAPYVNKSDGSTVYTYRIAAIEHSLLAPVPSAPNFEHVHMNDTVIASSFDDNEQVEGSTTYAEPPGTDQLARRFASVTQLPTIEAKDKWAAIAQGDSQLHGLRQLVDEGRVQCVLHAGRHTYAYLEKTVAECELTPCQKEHKFGLKFVQRLQPQPTAPASSASPPVACSLPASTVTQPHAPSASVSRGLASAGEGSGSDRFLGGVHDDDAMETDGAPSSDAALDDEVASGSMSSGVRSPGGKFVAIVPSAPKLKGPNAQPTAAVQTSMGLINMLRRLSGLPEMDPASSPLWAASGRAKLQEIERVRQMMPRLSDEFLPPITKAAREGTWRAKKEAYDEGDSDVLASASKEEKALIAMSNGGRNGGRLEPMPLETSARHVCPHPRTARAAATHPSA